MVGKKDSPGASLSVTTAHGKTEQHAQPIREQFEPPAVSPVSYVLHASLYYVLPLLFFTNLIIAGSIIISYSVFAAQPVPPTFITTISIIFAVLIFVALVIFITIRWRASHNDNDIEKLAPRSRTRSPIEPGPNPALGAMGVLKEAKAVRGPNPVKGKQAVAKAETVKQPQSVHTPRTHPWMFDTQPLPRDQPPKTLTRTPSTARSNITKPSGGTFAERQRAKKLRFVDDSQQAAIIPVTLQPVAMNRPNFHHPFRSQPSGLDTLVHGSGQPLRDRQHVTTVPSDVQDPLVSHMLRGSLESGLGQEAVLHDNLLEDSGGRRLNRRGL